MRKFGFLGIAFFGLVGTFAAPAFADPITNGNFETGNLNGWTVYTTSYSGWAGTNGTCVDVPCPIVAPFDTNGSGVSNAAEFNVGLASGPFDGSNFQGGGISQDINLNGGTLTVSMDWAVDALDGANEDGGQFAILLDGVPLATFNSGFVPPSVVNGVLTGTTTISTPGTYDLSIEVTRNFYPEAELDQYVDNITASGAATTPEPSSILLLGSGLVGLAGMIRRRLRT